MSKEYRQEFEIRYNLSYLKNNHGISLFDLIPCGDCEDSENKEFRFKECSVLEPIEIFLLR